MQKILTIKAANSCRKEIQIRKPDQIANRLFYTAKALNEFLAFLQTNDPEAVIAVFGDHQPISIRDIWLPNKETMLPQAFETPLLLVNTSAYSGKTGSPFAMYELPALILRAAGVLPSGPLKWTSTRDKQIFRPTVGGNDFYFTADNEDLANCSNNVTAECQKIRQLRSTFDTLVRALLFAPAPT